MRVACVALLLAGPALVASAAGSITDQAVTLSYGFSHWGPWPQANMFGTEPDPATDILTHAGWFYRAEGDTREHPFPDPDTETWHQASGTHIAIWNDLDGKDYYVEEKLVVLDGEGPSGGFVSVMTVKNNASRGRGLLLYHFLNPQLAGTPADDAAVMVRPGYLKLTDAVDPSATLRYRGWGEGVGFRVGDATTLGAALNDSDLDPFDDTGAPLAAQDAGAAFEIVSFHFAGETKLSAAVGVQARQTRDYVKGAFLDVSPWPALELENASIQTRVSRGLRREIQADLVEVGSTLNLVQIGLDDFDNDFKNDLVTRHLTTGEVRIGYEELIGAVSPPANWLLGATGDFNHDSHADLLWRNTTSQKLVVWFMNGATALGSAQPTPDQAAHANWGLAGAADFDGDGNRDILWYNQTSGNLVIWYMDANLVRLTGTFTTPASVGNTNWKVVAVADLGKGTGAEAPAVLGATDIVWQNDTSGNVVVWHMNQQSQRTSGVFTNPASFGAGFKVVGPR